MIFFAVEKTLEIVSKLCLEIFNMKSFVLLENEIPHLIGRWIQENYLLRLFPWQLARCQPEDEFTEYAECITLNIILHQPSLIPDLVEMMAVQSVSDLLTSVCIEWSFWIVQRI